MSRPLRASAPGSAPGVGLVGTERLREIFARGGAGLPADQNQVCVILLDSKPPDAAHGLAPKLGAPRG